jgi:hypothetical protein
MELDQLARSVEKCQRLWHFYGLSFYGDNDLSEEEIAEQAKRPHGYMRVSTVGRLRGLGFEPQRTGIPPHLSLRFSASPALPDLEMLTSLFGEPVDNPYSG